MANTASNQARFIYLLLRENDGRDDCHQPAGAIMCATTSLQSLREATSICIHEREISYGSRPSVESQVRELREDWKTLSRTELNRKLHGARFECVPNGVIN